MTLTNKTARNSKNVWSTKHATSKIDCKNRIQMHSNRVNKQHSVQDISIALIINLSVLQTLEMLITYNNVIYIYRSTTAYQQQKRAQRWRHFIIHQTFFTMPKTEYSFTCSFLFTVSEISPQLPLFTLPGELVNSVPENFAAKDWNIKQGMNFNSRLRMDYLYVTRRPLLLTA